MLERTLHCPSCGGEYMHHDRVTAHARAEDRAAPWQQGVHVGSSGVDSVHESTAWFPASCLTGNVVDPLCCIPATTR